MLVEFLGVSNVGSLPNIDLEKGCPSPYDQQPGPLSVLSTDSSDHSEEYNEKSNQTSKLARNATLSSIKNIYVPIALPTKIGPRWLRNFRWILYTTYRRLFSMAFLVNMTIAIALGAVHELDAQKCGTAAAVNLVFSILMRQEHVINVLFLLSSCLETSLPLLFRRYVAKIYCYGGLHSGCGVAAALWYAVFTGYATRLAITTPEFWPTAGIAYGILLLLLIVVAVAYPGVRMKIHNTFEAAHRFAGWTIVALYWAQMFVMADAQTRISNSAITFRNTIIQAPPFWCLIVVSMCLVYPWIRLRKRAVVVQKLSEHAARLHFGYQDLPRCMGVRLSTNPLFESHAFATIPAVKPEKGFSCVISNAGDWTKSIVQEPDGRAKIWIKGAPTYGVLRAALIFKRTVIVATGSGIGPCLSLLSGNETIECRVFWSTKSPVDTYGEEIVNAVLGADPNATIIDTSKHGRPDMLALTYRLYKIAGAEAVFVISNPKVTRKLIYGLEARGVPAYAPIFDS